MSARWNAKGTAEVNPGEKLDGKVAIVTGPTSGIGVETVKSLVSRGCQVYCLGRSESKLKDTIQQIAESLQLTGQEASERLLPIVCDTSSLASVEKAAQTFLEKSTKLNFLVNNAGIMTTPYGLSVDGFDLQMATNHIGHFHLTNLLLPRLISSAPSRIVNVSSRAHFRGKIENNPESLQASFFWAPDGSNYDRSLAYGNSKLANVLHIKALSKRVKDQGVSCFSVHPGLVSTNLGANWGVTNVFWNVFGIFMKNSDQGASTTLTCLLEKNLESETGSYFSNCAKADVSNYVNDQTAEAFWSFTEKHIQLWKNKSTG